MEKATFGGGCFWGTEELFRQIKGVKETAVGYMGGSTKKPTYQQVCDDTTGHVEVVQMTYDPTVTTYGKLLEVFWMSHHPTQADGQGNDIGSQYRPVIFFHSEEQKKAAEASKAMEQKKYSQPIATSIEPAGTFWPAEEYHQKYLVKNPGGYCHINVKAVLGHFQP
ncbi:MAG TPA: peptide-methionine (S)-S-oxide reductase MsrA [Candidatus Bilamarchaeum sp.]|nr:peptide-methionine (S)-S-oxide reductase MsrA [Candidatus Bilamarchaeum sp.]